MSQNNVIIELESLSRRYGYGDTESYALRDFDLTIKRGEFIMVMGPSGCGKTTLLNILGLLDRATSGEYYLNGESVASISAARQAKLRAKKIGFIFQNFNLIENLSVIENVALPLVYAGYSQSARLKTAGSILERFNLQKREYYFPHQLSGGQQQHVAIARAIVSNPEIILADEPTGNLDSRASKNVMELLKSIHEEGNTIIMVTHNPSLTDYATRVIHLLDGHIDTDIKTVADWDLPQPIAVKIKKRKLKDKILSKDVEAASPAPPLVPPEPDAAPAEKTNIPDQPNQLTDKSDKADAPTGKSDETSTPADKSSQPDETDKLTAPTKKPTKSEKPEKSDKLNKSDKPEKQSQSGNSAPAKNLKPSVNRTDSDDSPNPAQSQKEERASAQEQEPEPESKPDQGDPA